MYVCLYLYVYLFYCVYCVPCTANRKPVCIFTCGLLTFTEARRDRTTAHRLRPACRPDAESLGAAQCRCRLPCPVASPPLNGCRCVPGPQPVHTARPVHTPTRQQRKRRCMPCRCMPNPPLATGNRTRHVCAADNLQTRCKHVANNRRRSHPLKQYPETVQKLGKCPPSKASEDALRRTKCAN